MTKRLIRLVYNLKVKHWIIILVTVTFLLEYFGIFRMLCEKSYEREFSYPLEGDISRYVEEMKRGEEPSVAPYPNHDYYILKNPREKCLSEAQEHYEQIRVLYLVKSAARNFRQREVIRKTWGYQNRFADVPIRTVFLLGQVHDDHYLQARIEEEYLQFQDVVQGDFLDTYFNNSIKTAMGLRWAYQQCPRSRFYMFVDDDYYVSTRNLLRFLRNPTNYPGYLDEDVISFDESKHQQANNFQRGRRLQNAENETVLVSRRLQQLVDFDLPMDVRLYAGFVLDSARPLRHRSSKWFISLDEYPFNRWPPYVTAGSYVLSRAALMDLYYTSYYTKRFRFDDIWLGLTAKKAGLVPFHAPDFHFHRKLYTVRGYKYVVSSHGFSDPDELARVWNEQKEAGNA